MWSDVSTEAEGAEGAEGAAPTRVLLVDDHEMVADCLAAVVDTEPGLEVVGTAGGVAECLRLARGLRPDVVVMDLRLSDSEADRGGLEATRRLRTTLPDVSVVMLTAHPDPQVAREALDAGCCGIVAKRARLDELLAAIRAAADGRTWFPDEAIAPAPPAAGANLSAREREVLTLMASGRSTGDIAQELGLSVHTTRNHIRNLMAKLGVHSRLDAVMVAARCGLVRIPDNP